MDLEKEVNKNILTVLAKTTTHLLTIII
jgi:hypothetical protein